MFDRAALEGFYNEAEAASEGGEAATADAPADLGADGGAGEASADGSGAGADAAEPIEPQTKADKPRDANGKFAPKDKATREVKDKAIQTNRTAKEAVAAPASIAEAAPTIDGAASLQTPTPAETIRAPQSLTPAEREVFAKAPPEIQRALTRLDNAARVTARDFEPAKRFHQEMTQAMAPIRGLMQMRGVSEAQAVSSYANFDRMLSDPATSAQAAAQLLRSYNVNIEHLAAHLDRTPAPAQGQQSQSQSFNPNDIVNQVLQVIQGQRQESVKQTLTQAVEAFASDPKNEFFGDVAPEMTALLNANPKLTLEQAYQRATRANDDVWATLQKREAEKAGRVSTVTTQQKRLAASSVKSTPSTGASSGNAAPKNHRDMVAAMYDAAE
jgi:hypothetical protein